jgi:hypothetical protein
MKINHWFFLHPYPWHETICDIILARSHDYHHMAASSLEIKGNIAFQFFHNDFSNLMNSSILGPLEFPINFILLGRNIQ